ncbi:MAG: hypothetical protein ACE5J4_03570 [Candidatus Aenigmatarchaeota archaeon]
MKIIFLVVVIIIISSIFIFFFLEKQEEQNFNITCRNITETYWERELRNYTPRYELNHTLKRQITGNTTTYIAKVYVTNLENFTNLFIVNYTFSYDASEDKLSKNYSVSPNEKFPFTFYIYVDRGVEVDTIYEVFTSERTRWENITKTKTITICE